MQVFTQKRNPITGGTEWDVQHEDYDFHQEIARSAFADMLHDTERNKKYYRALQLAIEKMHADGKQANVLDIGKKAMNLFFELSYPNIIKVVFFYIYKWAQANLCSPVDNY